MKARSSSKRHCLWGNADDVAHRHQVCHKQVYGCISYNSAESSDIPQRYITKSGQEPTEGVRERAESCADQCANLPQCKERRRGVYPTCLKKPLFRHVALPTR